MRIEALSIALQMLIPKASSLQTRTRIGHYNKEFINDLLTDKNIYIEQKTRHTARYVVK